MKKKIFKQRNSTIIHLYDDDYIERKAEEYLKLKQTPHTNYLPFTFEGFLWESDIVDKSMYHRNCSKDRIKKCSLWGIKSMFVNEAV